MIQHGISAAGSLARLLPWLVVTAALVALISVPTSLAVQGLISLSALAALLLLRPFIDNRLGRLALLAVASIVVLRYWFWRLFDTLPPPENEFSFIAAAILFAVETYLIGVFFLSCLVVADPIDHRRPNPVRVKDLPTVDVLVPSLNEPAQMLAVTLAAARNMSYPEPLLNVVLCDDGGTDERCLSPDPGVALLARARREELSALCEELGVTYRARIDNRGAKAGNLTDALASVEGELVAIFDADHMPSRDFLARTVGYFAEDPGLALVQTPHFFLNHDPIARNLKLPEATPPENEMFYSLVHRGLDRWGGAFFCGSAAVLRREALDDVGGISGNTVTEDAETSMLIHARGWRSIYVNHAMVAGLQPETLASFIQQRGRWATGMIQLLTTRNPFLLRGLSFWQRLCYLNSMSYWMFPAVRLLLLCAPLVYLFFGLEIVVTTAPEALAYMGGYLAVAYLVQNMLFSKVRWPFLSEIYEVAQSPYLLRAVGGALLRPRSARFKVTSKEETIAETRLSDINRPLVALFVLMLAGVAALVWRWTQFPGDRAVLQIVGAWVIFNTVLVGASLRAAVEQRQRRRNPRVGGVDRPAVAEFRDDAGEGHPTPCVIRDISAGGVCVAVPPRALAQSFRRPTPGDRFMLALAAEPGLDALGPIECRVARCTMSEGRIVIGAAFEAEQEREAYRAIAGLINGDSRRWQAVRAAQTATRKGLLSGLAFAIRLGGAGVWHAFGALIFARPSRGDTLAGETAAGWSPETPIEAQAFIAARSLQSFPSRRPRPRPAGGLEAAADYDEKLNIA